MKRLVAPSSYITVSGSLRSQLIIRSSASFPCFASVSFHLSTMPRSSQHTTRNTARSSGPLSKRGYQRRRSVTQEAQSESTCSRSRSPTPAPIRLQVVWGGEITIFEVEPLSKISKVMSVFCLRQSCELSRIVWDYQGTLIRPNDSPLQLGLHDMSTVEARLIQPRMLPTTLDVLAEKEEDLFAQLEAVEFQIEQLQTEIKQQTALRHTISEKQVALTLKRQGVEEDMEAKRQKIYDKNFFCGLAHGRISELRDVERINQARDSSDSLGSM